MYSFFPPRKVKFGVSEPQKFPAKDGEEPKVYYFGTFENLGPVEGELQGEVMRAVKDLYTWFNSFKKKNNESLMVEPQSLSPQLQAAPEEEMVDVSSIPF